MKEINVSREELLKKVKENLEKHKKEYEEAVIKRNTQVIDTLKSFIPDMEEYKGKEVPEHLNFPKPVSYAEEYEEVIEMLTMAKDDPILISKEEFNRYVLDKWNWKHQFDLVKTTYGMK